MRPLISLFCRFPIVFQIQTVDYCNAECIMCPHKKQDMVVMDDSIFKKIEGEIAELPASCRKNLHFVLGLQNEPLLDKKLPIRIKMLSQLKARTSIITNGALLDSKMTQALDSAGIDSVEISINSLNEHIYSILCRGLDHHKVMANIRLLDSSNLKKKVGIRTVIMDENLPEIPYMKYYWRKKGFRFRYFHLSNRAGKIDLPMPAAIKGQESYNIHYSNGLCLEPFIKFSILCDGRVIPCCNDWSRSNIMGTIAEDSIAKIWNSHKWRLFRKHHVRKDYSGNKSCSRCSYPKTRFTGTSMLHQLNKYLRLLHNQTKVMPYTYKKWPPQGLNRSAFSHP